MGLLMWTVNTWDSWAALGVKVWKGHEKWLEKLSKMMIGVHDFQTKPVKTWLDQQNSECNMMCKYMYIMEI
jgi:hypothetical protein